MKVLTNITSILLAGLVLLSTLSFTVEKHYCGDFLMDVSFMGDAKDCGMEMEALAIKKKKSCCKDKIQKIEGQDELQKNSSEKFNLQKKQFLTAFLISYKELFVNTDSEDKLYKVFSPPDISKDYQILYQSFLI